MRWNLHTILAQLSTLQIIKESKANDTSLYSNLPLPAVSCNIEDVCVCGPMDPQEIL
jgi:hypothetical protein